VTAIDKGSNYGGDDIDEQAGANSSVNWEGEQKSEHWHNHHNSAAAHYADHYTGAVPMSRIITISMREPFH